MSLKSKSKKRQFFQKIPSFIEQKLEELIGRKVVAACVKRVSVDDIRDGLFPKQGSQFSVQVSSLPVETMPDSTFGRFGKRNAQGYDIVHRDRPKVFKEFGFWAPSWNGYSEHWVSCIRQVYERTQIGAYEYTLKFEVIDQFNTETGLEYAIRVSVNQVFDLSVPDFKEQFLHAINLLQEAVGACGVFPSDASELEYRAAALVDWEILPVGVRASLEELKTAFLNGRVGKLLDAEERIIAEQRFELFHSFQPVSFINGLNGMRRYFGAQLAENLVVFENLKYGNALYVMFENWEQVSQRSRIDLLSSDRTDFIRVPHRKGWEERLRQIVAQHRKT